MLKELSTVFTIWNIYLNYKPELHKILEMHFQDLSTVKNTQNQNTVNIKIKVEQVYFFGSITSHASESWKT